jgi:hypothetical protein
MHTKFPRKVNKPVGHSLKVEAIDSTEAVVPLYQNSIIPESSDLHVHRSENLTRHMKQIQRHLKKQNGSRPSAVPGDQQHYV